MCGLFIVSAGNMLIKISFLADFTASHSIEAVVISINYNNKNVMGDLMFIKKG